MSTRQAEARGEIERGLEQFSHAALKKIAQTLGIASIFGDAGYLGALAAYIGTPRHHAVLDGRLPNELWSLLALLPVQTGPFRARVLLVALENRGISPGDALAKIAKLMTYGCLLPVEGIAGTQRLGVDTNSLRTWVSSLRLVVPDAVRDWPTQRQPGSPRLASVEAPATVVRPELEELQRAVYILLAEAAAKPIRLTLKRAPYKAEITRLATALAGSPTASARGAKRKVETPVPPILWFALAALHGTRLLEERNQELQPGGDVGEFLGAPVADQVRRLLRGWRFGLFDDFTRIPTLSHPTFDGYGESGRVPWFVNDEWDGDTPGQDKLAWARSLICTAVRITLSQAPDAWHRIDDLANMIYTDDPEILFESVSDYELLNPRGTTLYGPDTAVPAPYFGIARAPGAAKADGSRALIRGHDWPEVEGAFVRQVIGESLRWLGLVEVGPDAQRPEVFRLTELGRHLLLDQPLTASLPPGAAQVIVQPNFEVVVVDALANAPLLARLNDFAERRSFDRAATYRLTQEALLRGLDHGWTGPRILELLESITNGPIPQNVRFTIQEWVHRYERISVREQATILEADNAAQIERWLADRTLAPLLGRRLGPTTVLLPANNATAVARRVQQTTKQLQTIDYGQPRKHAFRVLDPDRIEVDAVDPYLDYQLRAFSRREEQADGTLAYRISRESVGAANRAGRRGPDLVNFLNRVGGSPLPSDFIVRLLGWSGAVAPVTFEPLLVVYLPDEVVDWDIVGDIPALTPLIREYLSPTLALVAPGDLETLRAELAARGVELQAGVIPDEALAEEEEEEEEGLAFPGDSDLIRTALSRILGGALDFPDALGGGEPPSPRRRR
jgi:hypothetical protein